MSKACGRKEPKKKRQGKCKGCGHSLERHREYAGNGRNRHGSRLVCIADNCTAWTECRGEASEGQGA
jgi:hypothetical protein